MLTIKTSSDLLVFVSSIIPLTAILNKVNGGVRYFGLCITSMLLGSLMSKTNLVVILWSEGGKDGLGI